MQNDSVVGRDGELQVFGIRHVEFILGMVFEDGLLRAVRNPDADDSSIVAGYIRIEILGIGGPTQIRPRIASASFRHCADFASNSIT